MILDSTLFRETIKIYTVRIKTSSKKSSHALRDELEIMEADILYRLKDSKNRLKVVIKNYKAEPSVSLFDRIRQFRIS